MFHVNSDKNITIPNCPSVNLNVQYGQLLNNTTLFKRAQNIVTSF